MTAAFSAGVEKYASFELEAARRLWDTAESQMKEEKYREAKGSYIEAKDAFEKAAAESIYGTDLNPNAIAISRAKLAASKVKVVLLRLACRDFRDLFGDLFAVAAAVLKRGGRLVFANPLGIEPADPSLKLRYRRVIDHGGFNCRLEMYRRLSGNRKLKAEGSKLKG